MLSSTSLAVGNTGLSALEQAGTKLPSGQLHKVYINSHPAQSIGVALDAFFVIIEEVYKVCEIRFLKN